MAGNIGKLADSFCGVLFSGPGKQNWARIFSAAQLKGMQEVITLAVFAVFSIVYLKENLRWNHYAGFLLLIMAAMLIFKK